MRVSCPRWIFVLGVAVALSLLSLVPSPAAAQLEPLAFDRGASGLGLALRQVGAGGRVLYVTAHPDDEHNGVLVRLARGLGLRTSLLCVTRGEGGQNAIGPELFEALGVLRTEELMAMHRYDGVEQLFGRPYEFGYSFSVEETFAKKMPRPHRTSMCGVAARSSPLQVMRSARTVSSTMSAMFGRSRAPREHPAQPARRRAATKTAQRWPDMGRC